MTEFEYANMYLGDFKVVGNEIKPLYCPFCGGGNHQDRYTFALNMENHTFNCLRGSCGVKGHFSELCREKNLRYDDPADPAPRPKAPAKKYKKPDTKLFPLENDSPAMTYMQKRRLSPSIIAYFGVLRDGQGNIALPFYRSSEDRKTASPTFVKYRPPRKVEKGERKMWRETGAEPILFGMDLCTFGTKSLIITEGEFDCMAAFQAFSEKRPMNVVSVPSGAEDFTWLDTCADFIERFGKIVILGDSDEPGKKMAAELVKKLPGKNILLPDYDAYLGCKDMNELLVRHGEQAVVNALAAVKETPVEGLINFADVQMTDILKIPRTLSGIKSLDKKVGGFLEGDLTVWTGKRGCGKSSVLNQIGLDAIDQGKNLCIYSGEIPADRLKYQITCCAAGRENLSFVRDERTGRDVVTVGRDTAGKINRWLDRRLWLYDNRIVQTDERDSIINIFTAAYRRYDCRVFVVDNLMTVALAAKPGEMYQVQGEFVIRLRKFAEKYGVHVHVVVHPRKTNDEIKDSDEVGGSGTITNIACNVFTVMRGVEENDIAKIRCLKSRMYGETGDFELKYDPVSRRFSEEYAGAKIYGWEKLS